MATATEQLTLTEPRVAGYGLARTFGRRIAQAGVAGPVLVVAAALAIAILLKASADHWNLLGFVEFGRAFAALTHPPADAPRLTPFGYDGQFYWVQAHDPLLLHRSTLLGMSRFAPGLQRVAFPLLAFLLAAGRASDLPASLLAVNVLSVLALTAAVASFARRRGRSVWWSLAVGLTPGIIMASLRDLTDPLATAALVGGVIAWEEDRRWSAALLFTVAALTREPMIVGALSVALVVAGDWLRGPRSRARLIALARRCWPVVSIPLAVFIAWQIYIRFRYTGIASSTGAGSVATTPNLHPFSDFIIEAGRTIAQDSGIATVWDLAYMTLLLLGMSYSVSLAVIRPRLVTVAALGMSAFLAIALFGDEWGLARYGAPVFSLLLLAGLQLRSRAALLLALGAAVLTPFIPLMLPGAV